MPPDRLHGPLVGFVAGLVLLVNLGGVALHDEDEPRNAACSATMLARGDWVVPMFNGQVRLEKPALVNWLQMAGFAVAGRNETGARLGGALLTVGTCLLTWRIGRTLHGPAVGLLAGVAMATNVWTAVAGRAATPDAPLTFFTTLALALFVDGCSADGIPRPSRRRGLAIGAACGCAALAKGPVGLLFPLVAFVAAGAVLGGRDRGPWNLGGLFAARPVWILVGAALVAAPWYAWVAQRTGGAWLEGFLVVHNVRRFLQPMEGHSGHWAYYLVVAAVTFFPWSLVFVATLARAAVLCWRRSDPRHAATVIAGVWVATWLTGFSAAATKLPGYAWPAFPALAVLTAAFLHDWLHDEIPVVARRAAGGLLPDRMLTVGWVVLVAVGCCGAAVPWVAGARLPPTGRWLLAPFLIMAAGGSVAWAWQVHGHRRRALATLATTAAAFTGLLATLGPAAVQSGASGPRRLAALLAAPAAPDAWVSLGTVPASVVFYTGATVSEVDSVAAAVAHLERCPAGLVFAARDNGARLAAALPADHHVVHRAPLPFGDELLVVGRRASAEALAACPPPDRL